MSNIYEAVQKGDTEAAEIARAILEAEGFAQEPVERTNHTAREKPPSPPPIDGHYRTVQMKLSSSVPVFPFDGSDIRAAEQYRMIRTRIVQSPQRPRLIAVSSSSPGDGKTITSVNIAAALSLNNSGPVLLIDADFRRSRIAKVLGIEPGPGLNEVLSGTCELGDVIMRMEQFPNLYVVVAGNGWENAAELLDSPRWAAVCSKCRDQFQYTLVDTPPIAAVADYDLIQAAMDGIIVIVRPDHSRRAICLEAIKAVPQNKMLGIVLNCVDDWFLWKNRDYYYSSYA